MVQPLPCNSLKMHVIPRKPNEDTAPFLYQRREVKTFSKDRIIENQDRKLSQ